MESDCAFKDPQSTNVAQLPLWRARKLCNAIIAGPRIRTKSTGVVDVAGVWLRLFLACPSAGRAPRTLWLNRCRNPTIVSKLPGPRYGPRQQAPDKRHPGKRCSSTIKRTSFRSKHSRLTGSSLYRNSSRRLKPLGSRSASGLIPTAIQRPERQTSSLRSIYCLCHPRHKRLAA